MMMRLKHISLYLACMIILIHAVVPHHHHYDKPVCFQELFHQFSHNHHNCCETNSHDNHNHDFDKGNCIIDDYFTPKDDNEFKAPTLTQTLTQTYYYLIFNTLISDLLVDENSKVPRQTNQTLIYKDPLATNNFALRAPPMIYNA